MGNKPVKWIRLTLPVYSRAAIETVSTKKKYTNNLFVFLFLLYIFRLLLGPFAAALIQTTERQLIKTTVHNRARVCVCMWARASRAIQRFRVAWCSGESMSYRTASVSVNWVTTQIEIEREATTKTTCWWIRKKFIEKSFDRDEKLLVFLLDRQ